MPSSGVEPHAISGLLLRRTELGILLAAREPLTACEIAADSRLGGATTQPGLKKGASRVIADLLAYQARVGRVRKPGPATFVVLPGSVSRSTRRRCLRWRDEVARRRALEDCLPPVMTSPSSPLSDASALGESAFEKGELGLDMSPVPVGFESYAHRMVRIDHASLADLSALVDLESRLFEEDAAAHDTFIDLTWSQREGAADFTRLLDSQDCLVLVARMAVDVVGHLVGYTTQSSPTRQPVTYANLRSLYVLPAHRRLCVADLLVGEFLTWARDCGCVEAHVDHYTLNEPAQLLYERHGFAARSTSRALDLTTP